jgi:FkbM family methyltransferase
LEHPSGRAGLVEALVEIWIEKVYTPSGFYIARAGDVIVDVGANVGLFSIWMSRLNRACRVVALEPFVENYECLCNNTHKACPNNVETHQIALGECYRTGQMKAVGNRSLDHMLSLEDLDGSRDTIPVVPIQGLFDLARASRIALLKVDIEGAEYQAFERADSQTLGRIDRLAIEYHDHLRPGTLDMLRNRLVNTHQLKIIPSCLTGCGVLLARCN